MGIMGTGTSLQDGKCVFELANSITHYDNLAVKRACICEYESGRLLVSRACGTINVVGGLLASWNTSELLSHSPCSQASDQAAIGTYNSTASTSTRRAWHGFVAFELEPTTLCATYDTAITLALLLFRSSPFVSIFSPTRRLRHCVLKTPVLDLVVGSVVEGAATIEVAKKTGASDFTTSTSAVYSTMLDPPELSSFPEAMFW